MIIHQSMPFLMPVLPTFCHNLVEGVEESRWVGVQLLVKTSPLQMVKSQPWYSPRHVPNSDWWEITWMHTVEHWHKTISHYNVYSVLTLFVQKLEKVTPITATIIPAFQTIMHINSKLHSDINVLALFISQSLLCTNILPSLPALLWSRSAFDHKI